MLAGLLFAVALLVAGGLALALPRAGGTSGGGERPGRQGHAADAATTALEPSVLVLNGNGVEGAAGTTATALLTHGYRHAIPADAPNLAYARSLVLFRPGWQREAERLGKDARIATVAPLDGRSHPRTRTFRSS